MTLLSIREQEAVKDKRRLIVAAMWPTIYSAFQLPTQEECVKEAERQVDALILATRDAIARQVREEGEQRDNRGRPTDQSIGWEYAATFIEGLEVDR